MEDWEKLQRQDPFDLSRLDEDSLGAPAIAIAREMQRISDLAPRAIEQLGITVSSLPSPAANDRERAAYSLALAYQIEGIAHEMVASLRMAPTEPMTLGEYRFFVDFFHLPLNSSIQDMLAGAAKREQYMSDLRGANSQHRSLREYSAWKAEEARRTMAMQRLPKFFEADGRSLGDSTDKSD